MVAVFGALDSELAVLLARIERPVPVSWPGVTATLGRLGGTELVIVRTGVGKVQEAAAAASVAALVERPVRLMLSVGMCGSLDDALEIGTVVVADAAVQYDLDAEPLGFQPGEVPYTGLAVWQVPAHVVSELEAASRAVGAAVRVGTVLTGDRFVADPVERAAIRAAHHGIAVEMEGAAIGLVADARSLPWGILRVVSDRADGQAPEDFRALLTETSTRIADVVTAWAVQ